MSTQNTHNRATRKRSQQKEARLEIVAQLYKRGYSIRKIREEVQRRLDLPRLSKDTVWNDIKTLLTEWRAARLENMDEAIQLELVRIDDTVVELWDQWEKSKRDYTRTTRTRKGTPRRGGNSNADGSGENGGITTTAVENRDTTIVGLGDTSYIAEIRAQLVERRKLLGLYAPESHLIEGRLGGAVKVTEMSEEEIRAEIDRIKGALTEQ